MTHSLPDEQILRHELATIVLRSGRTLVVSERRDDEYGPPTLEILSKPAPSKTPAAPGFVTSIPIAHLATLETAIAEFRQRDAERPHVPRHASIHRPGRPRGKTCPK